MGRFLARALAAMEVAPAAEVAPAVAPRAAAIGFGGFGGFGECSGNEKAPGRKAPAQGFGGYGGSGERAENENQPPGAALWAERVDFRLTRDAVEISGLISAGNDWRWCSDGGLEITKPDGLLLILSPVYSRRLLAARLLPNTVLETALSFRMGGG